MKDEDEDIFEKWFGADGLPTPESEALKFAVGKAFIDDRRLLIAQYNPDDWSCRVVGLVPVHRKAYARRDELKPLVDFWVKEFLRMNAFYLGLHLHGFELVVEMCPEDEEDPHGGGSPERGLR